MKFLKITLLVVLVSVIFQSCKEGKEYEKLNNTPAQTVKVVHEIMVNEVIDGGGYTYLKVKEREKEYWMAISSANIKTGQTYYYSGGTQMKDFESKQLGKTFDFITFTEAVSLNKDESINSRNKNPHKK